MAQAWTVVQSTDTLSATQPALNSNFDAVRSCFSGTSFPTLSLLVGMLCMRTDTNKLYMLQSTGPSVWTLVADLTQSALGQTDGDARYFRQGFAVASDLILKGVGTGTSDVQNIVWQDGSGTVRWQWSKKNNQDIELKRFDGNGTYVDSPLAITGGVLQSLGKTLWHSGNDGKNSGLDADLLQNTAPTATGLQVLSVADIATLQALLGVAGAQTGDLKHYYGKGALSGWLPLNGMTIGDASSSANARANADCQSLFTLLWNNDSRLTVSGGRGASAAADWAAHKTLALPDTRGRALVGIDQMGATTTAGVLPSAVIATGSPDSVGSTGGAAQVTLTTDTLPAHGHAVTDPGHVHTLTADGGRFGSNGVGYAADQFFTSMGDVGANTLYHQDTNAVATGISVASAGNGSPHQNMQPSMLVSIYIKL